MTAVALQTGVSGHTGSNFYPYLWTPNTNIAYVIDNNAPTGNGFRDSIKFGMSQFSNLAGGQAPKFEYDGETSGTNDWNACGNERDKIFVKEDLGLAAFGPSYSELVLGLTDTCKSGPPTGVQIITAFQITLERTPILGGANGWNSGSGSPSNNEWDLRSIATHEAGHATGWFGHFESSSECRRRSSIASSRRAYTV